MALATINRHGRSISGGMMFRESPLDTFKSVFVHHARPEIPVPLNAEVSNCWYFGIPTMFLTCLLCGFFRLLICLSGFAGCYIVVNDRVFREQPFIKDRARGTCTQRCGYQDECDQGRNTHGFSPASARPGCRAVAPIQGMESPAYSPGAGSNPLAGFGCCIRQTTRHSGSPDRCRGMVV